MNDRFEDKKLAEEALLFAADITRFVKKKENAPIAHS